MSLKAGIAKVNITPPVGVPQAGFAARADVSQGVLDDLFAKTLVLDDGKLKIVIVTCDLLGLDKDVVAEIRRLIEKRTDISKNNVMIACSHTHSGPAIKDPGYLEEKIIADFLPQWIEVLPYKIAGAVKMASNELVEARVGVGKGSSDIGVNRRLKTDEGDITIGPNIQGITDPAVGLLRVDRADGSLLAVLVNYACHAVTLGPENLFFSADYPGYMMNILEKLWDGKTMVMFANGTAGNINPRIRGDYIATKRIGGMLAGEVLKIIETTETNSHISLNMLRKFMHLPLKKFPSLNKAKSQLQEKEQSLFKAEEKEVLKQDMSGPRGEIMRAKYRVRVIEELQRLENEEDLKANRLATEIQALRINESAFVALPGEIFVEIGLAIKRRSPFEQIFVIGYANDINVSYVPTSESYEEGGYEPDWAKVDQGADKIIEDEAVALLEELKNR